MTETGSVSRKASASDVALAAGVSMQTVSRVARGLDNVQPATRDRVRAAMDKLGYSPNRAARALRSGRFHTIGVIMFTLSSYGNSKTLEAIAEAASEADYTITLLPVHQRTQGGVTGAFARLSEQAVDGVIIVIEADILAERDLALPADVPVVVIDSSGRSARPLIDTDQAQGTRLAVQHLLDLGHETVWHVTGPENSYSSRRREAAWRSLLTDAGRDVPEPFRGDWTTGSGYRVGLEIAARPEITAVFVANDAMALGVLRACHETGRSIPASLSIVGFDDMTESESFWPPLTTIHQRFDEVGRSAIGLLLREMNHDEPASGVIVTTGLVVRESTAAPMIRS
ncbi:MAG: LacI family transcriptional regulator [Frondihabitans sp.]|nr:LacI family transcriptional regulator [Frondihabitans sp.]